MSFFYAKRHIYGIMFTIEWMNVKKFLSHLLQKIIMVENELQDIASKVAIALSIANYFK